MARDVRGRLFDWLWLLVWGLASSAWCVTAAQQLSATFDEPVYLARGLERWHTHSYQGLIRMGTMPLPVDVQTLPLHLWEQWRGATFDPLADMAKLLPRARAATLVFWWLLLIYGGLAGRQLAGRWGGRLAVVLLACEPTLLAHAGLATTDLAVSACLVAFAYHYRMGRDAGWLRRVGLPAFWFGATVLAKASGLVFGPLCILAIELERNGFAPRRMFQSACRDTLQILTLGMLVVFVYCGSDWQPEPSFVHWAHDLPEGATARVMTWLADHLCIFSNAGEGLVRQVRHNMKGHDGSYLLGDVYPRGSIWYYFPVALSIKLSIALLALPVVLGVLCPLSLKNWACLASAVLLLFSLNCHVQIGVRLVLPLVALAAVGLAGAAVRAWDELRKEAAGSSRLLARFRLASAVMLGSLVLAGPAWSAFDTVRVWPQGLCFTNELWGGTRNGYRWLSDSNYDWGQGLKELARWQARHDDAPLDVWYFGTDPQLQKLPVRDLKLHCLPLETPEAVRDQVRGHYLAVSTTLLYGMVADTPGHQAAGVFLRAQRPADRTTTFLIFDFRTP